MVCGVGSGPGDLRARTVIEAWADRTAVLSAMPGIREVFPFENRGEAIGVTLHHPHGQIYAYPYIPPRTQRLLDSIGRFDGDLFASILEFESSSDRVVLRGDHWIAFVPFAARWPVEVHMVPLRQVPDFGAKKPALDDQPGRRDELGERGGAALHGREHGNGLVQHADTASVVHNLILPSQISRSRRGQVGGRRWLTVVLLMY